MMEYKIIQQHIGVGDLESIAEADEELNGFAHQGWEIVAVAPFENSTATGRRLVTHRIYLGRRKEG